MENMKLSEQEQRCYSELFLACDPDRDQRVTGASATELFLSSGLPAETLLNIANMCGAKRLGYFGRSQFYIALKLIAVAQAGLPVCLESFGCGDIPLPKFIRQSDQDRHQITSMMQAGSVLSQPDYQERLGAQQQSLASGGGHGGLPPPPTHGGLPPPPTHGALPPPPSKHTRSFSGPRPPGVVTLSSQDGHMGNSRTSPPVNNNTSPRVSPRHSPPDSPTRRRIMYNKQASMPVAPSQVRAQSGVKLEKAWASFEDEDNRGLITNDRKEWNELSNEHARNLQDTISINSSEADADSVDDMWTINDEQREYYVRQFESMQRDLNGMIPGSVAKDFFEKSKLPVLELSKVWQLSDVNRDGALSLEEFCTAMHLVVLRRNDIELPDELPPSLMPYTPLVNSEEPFAADLPPGGTLKRLSPQSPVIDDQHWMISTSLDSPSNSGLSSPGVVKADLPGDYPDTRLHHMSRDEPDSAEDLRARALSDPGLDNDIQSPTRQRSLTDAQDQSDLRDKYSAPLHGRPRPTPKKAHSTSFSLPPHHGQLAPPPPVVPPRVSPGDAMKSYPNKSAGSDDEAMTAREQTMQATIREQRMRNTGLARLNTELNEELQEVMEQRIALEIQLEHLRPFSS